MQQDLRMTGSAVASPNSFGQTSYASQAAVPGSGDWMATLAPFGDSEYFWFAGQANRSLSVSVAALDASGALTESKAYPVAGMWSLAAAQSAPAPAFTPSAFNTSISGETRLDAVLNQTTSFRIGIADIRGDGRPDFRYHARVLYADTLVPWRASAGGTTPLLIRGLGFQPNDSVTLGTASVPPQALSGNQLLITAPANKDGVQNVVLSDPQTGGTSTMTGALTYGAGPTDLLKLISGASQAAPVGGTGAMPVVVQAVTLDGISPVAGASVFFTSSPAAALSPACGGAASCTALSNESGYASTYVTALSLGVITITAQLAPASYKPPQQVQAIVNGTESALDIALSPQFAWIAQGATLNLPLTARALANGTPLAGKTIDFQIMKGSALLSAASAVTDATGNASSTLQLSSLSAGVLVSACVQNQPVDSPCLNLQINAVPVSSLRLQPVSGSLQIAAAGQAFHPVTVRVTDTATPAHPVLGASINFQSLVVRAPQNFPVLWIGETGIRNDPMPVILSTAQSAVQSDVNGLATVQPTTGGVQGPVVVLGNATVGIASLPYTLQSFAPAQASSSAATRTSSAAQATPRSNLRQDVVER